MNIGPQSFIEPGDIIQQRQKIGGRFWTMDFGANSFFQ